MAKRKPSPTYVKFGDPLLDKFMPADKATFGHSATTPRSEQVRHRVEDITTPRLVALLRSLGFADLTPFVSDDPNTREDAIASALYALAERTIQGFNVEPRGGRRDGKKPPEFRDDWEFFCCMVEKGADDSDKSAMRAARALTGGDRSYASELRHRWSKLPLNEFRAIYLHQHGEILEAIDTFGLDYANTHRVVTPVRHLLNVKRTRSGKHVLTTSATGDPITGHEVYFPMGGSGLARALQRYLDTAGQSAYPGESIADIQRMLERRRTSPTRRTTAPPTMTARGALRSS